MKKLFAFTSAFCLLLMMNSCVSLTGLEEGRSLGQDNSEFGVSANLVAAPDLLGDDADITEAIDFIPVIEATYKFGITEKLDIGGRVGTNLNIGANAKYQLVGDRYSQFALAPGLEIATFAGLGYAVHIPVYASIHPTDFLSINLAPRFVYQFPLGTASVGVNYIGGNGGLLIGKRHKFGIDVGYYSVGRAGQRATLLTFGVGGKFRFGDNISSDSNRERGRESSTTTRKRKRR